ncbi:MAG: enoyl-CoA hydratase/isomerase family protein [Pseudomonadota bacterium]
MPEIELSRDGLVATLTLNRPGRGNALTSAMLAEIERLALSLREDEATRAVIVRAEGRHFSVGADLADPPSRAPDASLLMQRRAAELGGRMMRALQEIPQPTVCALHGVASGGGACIATACDFRVAARDARLGYGEARLGINLMWNALPLCVRLVGPARSKRLIMSGALFDAPVLERWGLVDELVEPADLDAAARAMAEGYAALPPLPVQMIKRSVDQVAGALDRAVMHMDADQWLLTARSQDHAEAVAAFFEKRPGDFSGD